MNPRQVRHQEEEAEMQVGFLQFAPRFGETAENLEKIFDPLFTTKAKGIGLGLVVCKRLIERQDGRLEVTGEAGQGATFTVHLRRTEGSQDA